MPLRLNGYRFRKNSINSLMIDSILVCATTAAELEMSVGYRTGVG